MRYHEFGATPHGTTTPTAGFTLIAPQVGRSACLFAIRRYAPATCPVSSSKESNS